MKKILCSGMIVFMMLLSTNTNAQVGFGIKGGVDVTSIKLGHEVMTPSNKVGFFIGPTVKCTLPVVGLGFDASLLYEQKKAQMSGMFLNSSTTLVQQQVILPINLRYSVGLGDLINVFAFAGPQFGFNIGDKSKSLYQNVADWKFSQSNLSLNFGVGATLFKHLQVTANYNFACGKTGELTLLQGAKNVEEGRNRSWQLGATYFF